MSWQVLLIVMLLILFAGLFFLVYRWPKSWGSTFSQHAAQSASASVYYSLLFAVTLPIITYLLVDKFANYYSLTPNFTLPIAASATFQIVCTFVPERGGIQKCAHQILAGLSAAFLLVAAFTGGVTLAHNNSFVLFMAFVGMLAIAVYGLNKTEQTPLALVQLLYYGAFFVSIMYLTVQSM